jgi:transcriptional repressor NrdR
VITGLKNIDQVAYIRFATVYLGLDDVESIRREIDKILDR